VSNVGGHIFEDFQRLNGKKVALKVAADWDSGERRK
jgi:hypothetical protein